MQRANLRHKYVRGHYLTKLLSIEICPNDFSRWEKPWNTKINPHFYLPTLNTILRLKRFSRNGTKNWRGSPNVTLINACLLTTVPNAEKYVSSHHQIQKQYLLEDQYGPKNILLKITKRSDNLFTHFLDFQKKTEQISSLFS